MRLLTGVCMQVQEMWYSWRYQLEAFKGEYHVVAPDLRGYGASERPQVHACMLAAMSAMEAVMDTCGCPGVKRCTFWAVHVVVCVDCCDAQTVHLEALQAAQSSGCIDLVHLMLSIFPQRPRQCCG